MKTAALALAVAAAVVPARLARADEAADLKAAVAAFQAGDYKKTVEELEKIPAEGAGASKARYLEGECRLLLGEPEKAEAAFRFVLEKKPAAVPAKVGLGRALTALGKNEDAEKALKEAVAADAKDVSAKRALGELWIKTGRLEEAEKVLEEAWKAAPNDPLTARALCEARLRRDDAKEAYSIAARLVKALPKHPMGPFLEALALEKEGKDDEAIKAYEVALALDDKFLDAHKNLAILCHTRNPTYQDAERTKKAMAHYERYFALGGADTKLKELYDSLKAFLPKK